jgi:hypothetical protein
MKPVLKVVEIGVCKLSYAANVVIFFTDANGKIIKIIWFNVAVSTAGRTREQMPKAIDDLQKKLDSIRAANSNNPEAAAKAMRDFIQSSDMVESDKGKKVFNEFPQDGTNLYQTK